MLTLVVCTLILRGDPAIVTNVGALVRTYVKIVDDWVGYHV